MTFVKRIRGLTPTGMALWTGGYVLGVFVGVVGMWNAPLALAVTFVLVTFFTLARVTK